MAEVSFFNEHAFTFTVGEEGGYSVDPNDKGNWTSGEVGMGQLKGTKFGVSAAAFPNLDIANLTLEQARGIAKTKYWDAFNGDSLVPAVAFVVFDLAFNAGVHEAVVLLQRALGITEDGACGPKTQAAANCTEPKALIRRYTDARIAFYSKLPGWPIYGRGWAKRATAARDNALAM